MAASETQAPAFDTAAVSTCETQTPARISHTDKTVWSKTRTRKAKQTIIAYSFDVIFISDELAKGGRLFSAMVVL